MDTILDRLKSVAAGSRRLARQLEAYRRLLEAPVDNAIRRREELEAVGRLVDGLPEGALRTELRHWLKEEEARVEQARDELRFRFGARLGESFAAAGIPLRGQLPLLRSGLFSLRVDFETGSAALFWGPEVERLASDIELSPDELLRAVTGAGRELAGASVEPDRLIRRLSEGYGRACAARGIAPGERVLLLDVLAELVFLMQPKSFRADPSRRRFAEYPRVQFSHDLYRLRSSPAAVPGLRLHVANFDATTDRVRALWVPDNEQGDGTYYSYISFSKGGQ